MTAAAPDTFFCDGYPPDTMPDQRWDNVGAHRLHVRERLDRAPAGRTPVVLVHGLMVSSLYLVPTLRHLAPHVPVLAPDMPGYGNSSKPPRDLDIVEQADVLVQWMDARGLDRVSLFGNSLGCQVIAAAASRHPRRVARVVLQGPTMDPAARSVPRSLWRGIRDLFHEPPITPIWLREYGLRGCRKGLASYRRVLDDAIEKRLPHMPMPTLVVRGRDDPLVPAAWAEEVAARLPQGRLVTIPGAHILVYHRARELVDAVLGFLVRE